MKTTKAKGISRTKNWRVLLYGKPGVGKTSAARGLKGKTLVLSLDNSQKVLAGADNVDVWKDPKFPDDDDEHSFDREFPNDSIAKFIRDQAEIEANYDNLVVDNVSSFQRDWFVWRGRSSKNGINNEIQDYSAWTNYFSRVITTIYMFKGINILLTAWEGLEDVTAETGQTFQRYTPDLRDSVRDSFLGLTDMVGRVVINPTTGGHGVILEGNDTVFAKNRLDGRKVAPIEELFNFDAKPTPAKTKQPTKQ